MEELKRSSFQDLIQAVEDLPPSVVALLRKTIDLNKGVAEIGLAQPLGLGIGFHQSHDEESLDMKHSVSSSAAAGSDARMSGYPLEVMSSAGSGNQGIVATLPVVAYCDQCDVEEDRLLRALALSHLVTMYVTTHVGALSALCGAANKAGIGAACGITYAMGGEVADICRAVKIAVASTSGLVCDGAKPSCALKVISSSEMALRAASLAMKKVQVCDADGVVDNTAEQTIQNLARLGRSMTAVDDEIVQIMEEKFRQHGK
jgi:L-cysteine desulfidase